MSSVSNTTHATESPIAFPTRFQDVNQTAAQKVSDAFSAQIQRHGLPLARKNSIVSLAIVAQGDSSRRKVKVDNNSVKVTVAGEVGKRTTAKPAEQPLNVDLIHSFSNAHASDIAKAYRKEIGVGRKRRAHPHAELEAKLSRMEALVAAHVEKNSDGNQAESTEAGGQFRSDTLNGNIAPDLHAVDQQSTTDVHNFDSHFAYNNSTFAAPFVLVEHHDFPLDGTNVPANSANKRNADAFIGEVNQNFETASYASSAKRSRTTAYQDNYGAEHHYQSNAGDQSTGYYGGVNTLSPTMVRQPTDQLQAPSEYASQSASVMYSAPISRAESKAAYADSAFGEKDEDRLRDFAGDQNLTIGKDEREVITDIAKMSGTVAEENILRKDHVEVFSDAIKLNESNLSKARKLNLEKTERKLNSIVEWNKLNQLSGFFDHGAQLNDPSA